MTIKLMTNDYLNVSIFVSNFFKYSKYVGTTTTSISFKINISK